MSLIEEYIKGERIGWAEVTHPGLAKAEFAMLDSQGVFKQPLKSASNIPDSFSLHTIARKVLNQKDVGGGVQKRGDCVSWGAKHTSEYLQCVLSLLKNKDVKYRPVFAPYYYGTGRTYVGRGQLGDSRDGKNDGSLGTWMAEAVQKYGTLFADEPGVPEYSGDIAGAWGDRDARPDLDKWQAIAKVFLVKSVAKINNWDELCAALANGYPCTVASNVGYEMTPGSEGYHRRSGSWAHQMMIYGYDNKKNCALITNSWGDVHGRLKDFNSDDAMPIGTIRARKDAINEMIAANEVFTFGDMDGFHDRAADIEKALFDLIGKD